MNHIRSVPRTPLCFLTIFIAISLSYSSLACADLAWGYVDTTFSSPVSFIDAEDGSFNYSVSGTIKDMAFNPATGNFHAATDEGEYILKADGSGEQAGFFNAPLDAIAASSTTVAWGYVDTTFSSPVSFIDAEDGSFNYSVSGTIKDLTFNPATGDFHVATDEGEYVLNGDGTGVAPGFFAGPFDAIAASGSVVAIPETSTVTLWCFLSGGFMGRGLVKRLRTPNN